MTTDKVFCYLIAEEESLTSNEIIVKIGQTRNDPNSRLSQLQTGNCRNLVLMESTWVLSEAEMHRRCKPYKSDCKGEWFKLPRAVLDELVAEFKTFNKNPPEIVDKPIPERVESANITLLPWFEKSTLLRCETCHSFWAVKRTNVKAPQTCYCCDKIVPLISQVTAVLDDLYIKWSQSPMPNCDLVINLNQIADTADLIVVTPNNHLEGFPKEHSEFYAAALAAKLDIYLEKMPRILVLHQKDMIDRETVTVIIQKWLEGPAGVIYSDPNWYQKLFAIDKAKLDPFK